MVCSYTKKADGFFIPCGSCSYRFNPCVLLNPFPHQHSVVRDHVNSMTFGTVASERMTSVQQSTVMSETFLPSLGNSVPEENFSIMFAGLVFATAVGIFAYANLVLTPEIVEGASLIRQENRQMEVQRLIDAVNSHVAKGNDLEDLRIPLEAALGVPLETYVEVLDEEGYMTDIQGFPPLGEADQTLAFIIKNALYNDQE
ncbi:hypothetical protein IV203_010479 [Nitzschia inconspicua]|uniref:Uncharacterized protein n=1 Tax=Nitzschia inconspicua TaxID=303405 RepID=A0A9K3PN43_9STRA|nr:hypothetical protein IV203_010479 [Nitzschia inconspicua]